MKKTKTFLLSAALTVFAFSTVLYTSCHKSQCSGVVCYNGGACSGGICSCPSGFYGDNCQLTGVVFANYTPTPINLTVNGANTTIDVNSSVTFSGNPGDPVAVSASTSGTYGQIITWSYTDYFPNLGNTLTEPFDVSADYFYLIINSIDRSFITEMRVNYNTFSEQDVPVSVPGDGNSYGMGYFEAYNNTKVDLDFTSGPSVVYNLAIPNKLDATYTLYVN